MGFLHTKKYILLN